MCVQLSVLISNGVALIEKKYTLMSNSAQSNDFGYIFKIRLSDVGGVLCVS